MFSLFVIAFILLGIGVTLLLRVPNLTPSKTSSAAVTRAQSYGFAVERSEPVEPVKRRPVIAFAAGLGGFAERVFGLGEHSVQRLLLTAGMYDTDPRTIVGFRVLGAALAPLWFWLGVSSDMSFGMVVLGTVGIGLLGWFAPVIYLSRKGRQRVEKIDYELPELIDLLVVTLEAGLSFLASLHIAAERLQGPMGVELRLMLQEQRMGLAVNDALENMLRRCETPSLRTFVRSVIQGESLGVSTGQIMRNLALEMRKRRRAIAEQRAQKAPTKMLFPLIFLIFPAMFVVLLGPVYWTITETF
jgi:tight adherence protein C